MHFLNQIQKITPAAGAATLLNKTHASKVLQPWEQRGIYSVLHLLPMVPFYNILQNSQNKDYPLEFTDK
jgi:hypothetical protein